MPFLFTSFSLLKDLHYYLWGLTVLDENSTQSVFCGIPRPVPATHVPILSSFPEGSMASVKKFTMLYHNGVYYRSTRTWQKKACAGDVVFLRSGEICEINMFLLDQGFLDANKKKLFLASFAFIRVEPGETEQGEQPVLLVRRTVLPAKKLLSVSEIECSAVLCPAGEDLRVLRLSPVKF